MEENSISVLNIKNMLSEDETIIYRDFKPNLNNEIVFTVVYASVMINKEYVNNYIVTPIMNGSLKNKGMNKNRVDGVIDNFINSLEVKKSCDLSEIVEEILSGYTAIFISECSEVILVNTAGWKSREIKEPESETIITGPREGFTEAIDVNISLVRRKIKDYNLKFKFKNIGKVTKTKICICYIKGMSNDKILNELMERLNKIDLNGILDSEYIQECISDVPFSIFKTVGSTERPDVIAAKLLEGKIAIICDGTPMVLFIPYLFIEGIQMNEDYYNNHIYSSIFRLLRFLGLFFTTSVPAIYIALVTFHQEIIPTKLLLSISQARRGVPFPTVIEAFAMVLVFEILREAGTRIPKQVGQAVSIVGALVLGDAAVNARFVSAPIVIVTALTGISAFLLPKLVSTITIRLFLMVLSSLLGLYGYTFGVMAILLYMISIRSFGVPYILNAGVGKLAYEDIQDTAVRIPWIIMKLNSKHKLNLYSRRKRTNKESR